MAAVDHYACVTYGEYLELFLPDRGPALTPTTDDKLLANPCE